MLGNWNRKYIMHQIEIFEGSNAADVAKNANAFLQKLGKENFKGIELATCVPPPMKNSPIPGVRTTIVVTYIKNV